MDELNSKFGDKVYLVAFENFFKIGVTDSPRKRMQAIVTAFKEYEVYLEESYYYEMPDGLAYVVKGMIKKEFDNYEGVEKYKTECFPIEVMEDVMERILELTEPFGEVIKKYTFIRDVSIVIDEFSDKPILKSTRHMYSTYKLIMNNRETFDDLFAERLERDRKKAKEVN